MGNRVTIRKEEDKKKQSKVWNKVHTLPNPKQETKAKRTGFLFKVRNVEMTIDKDEKNKKKLLLNWWPLYLSCDEFGDT